MTDIHNALHRIPYRIECWLYLNVVVFSDVLLATCCIKNVYLYCYNFLLMYTMHATDLYYTGCAYAYQLI
jgi:hypothetical protein